MEVLVAALEMDGTAESVQQMGWQVWVVAQKINRDRLEKCLGACGSG